MSPQGLARVRRCVPRTATGELLGPATTSEAQLLVEDHHRGARKVVDERAVPGRGAFQRQQQCGSLHESTGQPSQDLQTEHVIVAEPQITHREHRQGPLGATPVAPRQRHHDPRAQPKHLRHPAVVLPDGGRPAQDAVGCSRIGERPAGTDLFAQHPTCRSADKVIPSRSSIVTPSAEASKRAQPAMRVAT